MPAFPGLSHVAVTVSDLTVSTEWYSRLFDSEPVLDEDEESGDYHHTVYALGGGMLFGLHTHTAGQVDGAFDETRSGVDHIAFACTQDELDAWSSKLDDLGITHSAIKHAHYGSGISFRDPDNVALEFFAPPA
ncbi:glyoxalase [Rhodococcoides trifolii]|uniref:Glyoxalase n=1 Tax=Rhodococcoides trifolii TaxID=908250 RepID=A0A917LI70_9NOCA|nr:VOC family protein [Rhodococcus trifolii]GGG26152.1 glyoxalase [Rhodococcus trifolii]